MPAVTIYSTSTCPYCKMAKAYLQKKNVPFTDVDVSVDAAKAEEMIEKSGQLGVPVLDIGGRIVIGFDQPQIEAALVEMK